MQKPWSQILVATKNPGKFGEMMEVLDDLPYEFLFLGALDVNDFDFAEDGETFKDNAFKKAAYYGEKLGVPAIGEDSGILVEALKGELGVKTRRWGAGADASDEEWMEVFFERMKEEKERRAKFVCTACLVAPDVEQYFVGETVGELLQELQAPIIPGIPLSSCFVPEGREVVYAAMNPTEKNAISHRGSAMKSLREFLASQL